MFTGICHACAGAWGGQKSESDQLEQEWHVVGSYRTQAGNLLRSSVRAGSSLSPEHLSSLASACRDSWLESSGGGRLSRHWQTVLATAINRKQRQPLLAELSSVSRLLGCFVYSHWSHVSGMGVFSLVFHCKIVSVLLDLVDIPHPRPAVALFAAYGVCPSDGPLAA